MTFDISTLSQLKSAVKSIVPEFTEKQIVLLEGSLGAGKTQFVRYVVETLNGGEICSPSFAIHNIYETEKGDVDHIDLYRLEDQDDIASTGFWDVFEKESGLIFIEWSNYIPKSEIPSYWDRLLVHLEVKQDGARKLTTSKLK